MPLYSYKAIDARGKRILGRVEAVNLFDLDQRLARMDLDLVVGAPSHLQARLLGGGIRRQDLINFCFQLEQLTMRCVTVPKSEAANSCNASSLRKKPRVCCRIICRPESCRRC